MGQVFHSSQTLGMFPDIYCQKTRATPTPAITSNACANLRGKLARVLVKLTVPSTKMAESQTCASTLFPSKNSTNPKNRGPNVAESSAICGEPNPGQYKTPYDAPQKIKAANALFVTRELPVLQKAYPLTIIAAIKGICSKLEIKNRYATSDMAWFLGLFCLFIGTIAPTREMTEALLASSLTLMSVATFLRWRVN